MQKYTLICPWSWALENKKTIYLMSKIGIPQCTIIKMFHNNFTKLNIYYRNKILIFGIELWKFISSPILY